MSETTITKKFFGFGGVPIDPGSVVFSDFDGTFGVKRLDTGAVVVADGVSLTRIAEGEYSYTFTDPAPNLVYEYWVQFLVGGDTFYSGMTVNGTTVLPGYSLRDMTDELGMMLNELNQAGSEPFEYTPAMGVNLLNKGQEKVLTLIPGAYFTGLHVKDEDIALDASGSFGFASLTRDIYSPPKGLMGVRLNGDRFARRIAFEEYLELAQNGIEYAENEPAYYVAGDRVYVYPATAADMVDVHYLRAPVKMVIDPYGERDDDVSCELPREVQDVLLDFAAARGYKIGRDLDRAVMANSMAMNGVKDIADRLKSTDSIGMSFLREMGTTPLQTGKPFDFYRGR